MTAQQEAQVIVIKARLGLKIRVESRESKNF